MGKVRHGHFGALNGKLINFHVASGEVFGRRSALALGATPGWVLSLAAGRAGQFGRPALLYMKTEINLSPLGDPVNQPGGLVKPN